MCRVLNLCPGTYYGRERRPPPARAQRDAVLLEQITDVHQASYDTYGAYRVHKQHRRQGVQVARCTVERLMRSHGLHALAAPGPAAHHHTGPDGAAAAGPGQPEVHSAGSGSRPS
ncbi:IS3 family transposase [Actinomadura sp. 9N407]|uniref:IS3 family transposase n=1 Tax=Actinomadura sp. 9N407 TaxID=3375154 RepID=UPI003794708A